MDVFLPLCLIKYTCSLLSFPESLSGCMLDVFLWLFVLLDFSYLAFSDVFPAIIVCHLLYAYLFFFPKFFSFKVIKVLLQCPEYLSASLLISCFVYKHTFHFFHLTTLMSKKAFYCLHILGFSWIFSNSFFKVVQLEQLFSKHSSQHMTGV